VEKRGCNETIEKSLGYRLVMTIAILQDEVNPGVLFLEQSISQM